MSTPPTRISSTSAPAPQWGQPALVRFPTAAEQSRFVRKVANQLVADALARGHTVESLLASCYDWRR